MTNKPFKSLDRRLANIHKDPSGSREFIIADAKDADMAFGVTAPGRRAGQAGGWRSLADYRDQIKEIIAQGIVDIMLLSASSLEKLAIQERLFALSPVTPAARANDTSDIWVVRGGRYPKEASRSFRSATLEHIMYGTMELPANHLIRGADLGLYSITFTNNLDWDYMALQHYHDFRIEAEKRGFRHFLEVFNPNVDPRMDPSEVPAFLNDHIARTLAGVASKGRPIFLKIPYNGPAALEELVSYDPHLVVGILGGSAGTTYDAFKLIEDAKRHGARVALFGRKINLSEHPLTFVRLLRAIADEKIGAREAVRVYHDDLHKLGIVPLRDLKSDLELTPQAMCYR